MFYHNITVMS